MYYDVVPAMSSYEDVVSSVQTVLLALAVLLALPHLPIALMAAATRQWPQALGLGVAAFAPLAIVLAADGVVSHLLWWGPISDTDRFHVLHHTLTTALPLSVGYALFLRFRWRVDERRTVPPPSPLALAATGLLLSPIVIAIGILAGLRLAQGVLLAAAVALVVFSMSRSLSA